METIDIPTYIQALKWWNALTDNEKESYRKKFVDSLDRHISRVAWNNRQCEIYGLYTMVKCLE